MYSYNPNLINDGALNQMRFYLGDCLPDSFYLSDEEICAALNNATFKRAALRLVESLLFRFSYEVDTKIHEAEFDLSDRVANWRKLRDDLKAELEEKETVTQAFGFAGRSAPSAIFTRGMFDYVS